MRLHSGGMTRKKVVHPSIGSRLVAAGVAATWRPQHLRNERRF
jgi:hypothetical protein